MIDPTLVHLAKVIQHGWPEKGKELESDVKPYFQHRFELHIVNGVIFLQNRIVIPVGLRCGFLDKLHDSHMEIAKTRLLARMLIYWPKWNDDIKRVCSSCEICKENQHMLPNVPKFQVNARGPGEIYGIDIAEIQGSQHIVCVDYFSCCIFKRKLANLTSTCVIDAWKDIFCDVGSPDKIISDNTRYFISEEFKSFVMDWSIEHLMSSPRFLMLMLKKQWEL